MHNSKYVKSKYIGVNGRLIKGRIYWRARVLGEIKNGFKTERDAGIAVDKIYILKGKEPINILKRK